MRKKRSHGTSSQGLNFKDFKWCVDNDFQVYVKPLYNVYNGEHVETGKFKIAVRRRGITTEGYNSLKVNGRVVTSKETLSELTFDNQRKAFENLNYVYNYLRKKYG